MNFNASLEIPMSSLKSSQLRRRYQTRRFRRKATASHRLDFSLQAATPTPTHQNLKPMPPCTEIAVPPLSR
ncbi:hypothetical protein [Nostoc linckia]|uniref:hypothetical protein n=1 Tax=Nostoc linckia TaxID=92942 RepID=UPI00117CBB5D|nr:hypothetical protein [Nostoc linckia]